MKELYTKKLYYKKWNHRVVIRATRSWVSQRGRKRTEVPVHLLYEALDKYEPDTYRSVETNSYWNHASNVSIFFSNPEILETLKKKFEYALDVVERPYDDKHSDALEGERCLVREKLYYGLYRYAIRMKMPDYASGNPYASRVNFGKEVITWVNNYQKTVKREGRDYTRVNSEWNMTVFFAEAQDAMTFRLTWSDHIKQVDRIKLLSEVTEIKSDEPEASGDQSETVA